MFLDTTFCQAPARSFLCPAGVGTPDWMRHISFYTTVPCWPSSNLGSRADDRQMAVQVVEEATMALHRRSPPCRVRKSERWCRTRSPRKSRVSATTICSWIRIYESPSANASYAMSEIRSHLPPQWEFVYLVDNLYVPAWPGCGGWFRTAFVSPTSLATIRDVRTACEKL
jgi:hypothetical protein